MLKSLFKILSLSLTLLLCSCSHSSSEEPAPPNTDNGGTVGPQEQVDRTVLVYMVANCDLGDPTKHFDKNDLKEMLKLSGSELLKTSNLVAYHQPVSGTPQLKLLTPDGFKSLKSYDKNEYSVSSKRMNEVIADMKQLTPAKRYGLVLWSHSTGWVQDGLAEKSIQKSYGNDAGRTMNITTLANVLNGKGFDFIYFDCCHMANIETLYELRNCAKYFVGSTTIVPGDGMPYHLTIPHLLPYDADCVGAAKTTFEHYNAMSGDDRSSTMSVIDASKLEALAQATAEIYSLGLSMPSGYRVQQFEPYANCRYFDFEEYVRTGCAYVDQLARFEKALDEAVIYKAATPSIWSSYLTLRTHCGLSTFILQNESYSTKSGYNQLAWWTDVASKLFN